MAKLVDTDGLSVVLDSAMETFLPSGGNTLGGSSGHRFNVVPVVGNDGVMEIGEYIDFHASDGDTSDYAGRISCGANGTISANGTQLILSTGLAVRTNGTDSITRNTTNCSSLGTTWLSRNAFCCTLSVIDLTNNTSIGSGGNLIVATIPSGFRPPANVYASCFGANAQCTFRLTSSGELRLSNRTGASIASGTQFTATLTYVLI
jgi:hypothetical protein